MTRSGATCPVQPGTLFSRSPRTSMSTRPVEGPPDAGVAKASSASGSMSAVRILPEEVARHLQVEREDRRARVEVVEAEQAARRDRLPEGVEAARARRAEGRDPDLGAARVDELALGVDGGVSRAVVDEGRDE